jgi:metal-sulfur cluster biosynthetic enzyme
MSVTSESGAASAVRAALERVVDPCSIATGTAISLPEMGLIKDVREKGGGRVIVDLRLTSPFCFQIGLMLERIQEVTRGLAGVREVTVAVDHGDEWLPRMMSPAAQARLRRIRPAQAVLTRPASGHPDPQLGER